MIWADNMRFFAVLTVVVLHVAAGFVGGIEPGDELYGEINWWAGNIFDSITRWCVPIFVMISGYFLLNNKDDNLSFFKKRVNRIFIPLIFWSVIFSLWIILRLAIKNDLESAPSVIAKGFILGKPYFHLWYLYMIPLLYASTPFLKLILEKSSKKLSLIFIIAAFSISATNILFNYALYLFGGAAKASLFVNSFLMYIGYFTLGGYIKKYDIKIKSSYLLLGLAVAWLITILGSYFFTYKYFYNYLSLNTITASILIFFLIMRFFTFDFLKSTKKLAALSFGVYLIHPIFLDIVAYTMRDKSLEYMNAFLYIPIFSIIIFIASLFVAYIMSKIVLLKNCI